MDTGNHLARTNNFNLLRLCAAVCVIVSHSYPLSLGPGTVEPLHDILGYDLGKAAVKVFFAVSGFLIYKSFRRSSLAEFGMKRALRLLPGLLAVTVVTAFVIGPLFSTGPGYFSASATYVYVPASMALPSQTLMLPGLFADNPMTLTNGALWTLHYEAVWYAILALGLLLLRGRFAFLLAAFAALYLLLPANYYATFGLPFMVGAAVAHYRIALTWRVAALLCLLSAGLYGIDFLALEGSALALSYTSLWTGSATTPVLKEFNRLGDYSYGVYVWGWPIQQVIAPLHPQDPLAMMALAIPAALACGVLSWHLIEKPALRLKPFGRKGRTDLPVSPPIPEALA